MSKIKVLKLEFWMLYDREWKDRDSNEQDCIGPAKFNRNGWYLQGDKCWFEYKGMSYSTENLADTFRNKLKRLNTTLLTQKQVDYMRALIYSLPKSHIQTIRQLRARLHDDWEAKQIRGTGRQARKINLRIQKKLEELNNEL